MSDFTIDNTAIASLGLDCGDTATATEPVDLANTPVLVSGLEHLANRGVPFDPEGPLIQNLMREALCGEIEIKFLEPVSICFLDMDGRSLCSGMRTKMELLLGELGIDTTCGEESLVFDETGRFTKHLAGNVVLGVHGSVVIEDGDQMMVRHLRDEEVQRRLSFSCPESSARKGYDYAVVYPTNEGARIHDCEGEVEYRSSAGANIARLEAAAQYRGLTTRIVDMTDGYSTSREGDKEFGPLFRMVLADQMFAGNVCIRKIPRDRD